MKGFNGLKRVMIYLYGDGVKLRQSLNLHIITPNTIPALILYVLLKLGINKRLVKGALKYN